MIFESYPWKQELKRLQKSLRTWAVRPNSGRAEFYIQRAIFFSAFAVRKLMENRKVTDVVRDKSIRCNAFRPFRPISDRVSTFFGLADITIDYEMTKPEQMTLNCFDLMSEIMHSYVFKIGLDEKDAMICFLVNSYNKRDARLIEIDLTAFESIVRDVIHDRIDFGSVQVHPVSGKIVAKVGRKQP
jgi:hypothetical protein